MDHSDLATGWNLYTGQCLRRWYDRYSDTAPDAAQIEILERSKKFYQFEVQLRVNLHDTMHCMIGKCYFLLFAGVENAYITNNVYFLHFHGP